MSNCRTKNYFIKENISKIFQCTEKKRVDAEREREREREEFLTLNPLVLQMRVLTSSFIGRIGGKMLPEVLASLPYAPTL